MTREEGLDWLYRLRSEIYVYMPKEWLISMNNALDMAIKALEHPEKNVIAVVPCGDAISRSDVLKLMQDNWHTHNGDWAMQESMDDIRALPSVTPQLSSELEKNSKKLEKDFGELDCISRADAIQAMQDKAKKLTNEDTINGLCGAVAILFELPSVTPQEPVLDKIRDEIERKAHSGQWSDATMYGMLKAVAIIDKYKAESEPQESEDKE